MSACAAAADDARADARFVANPQVTAAPGYRHYAAAPICLDNIPLKGTVRVMWHAPGRLGGAQRESLRLLAQGGALRQRSVAGRPFAGRPSYRLDSRQGEQHESPDGSDIA